MPIRQPSMFNHSPNIFIGMVYHQSMQMPVSTIVYAGDNCKLAYEACLQNSFASYTYLEVQHWANDKFIYSFDVEKEPYFDYSGVLSAPAPTTMPKEEIERQITEAITVENYEKAAKLRKLL